MIGMPGGKRAKKYLLIGENFWVGQRYFGRGEHLAFDDPIAPKLLKECPQWVYLSTPATRAEAKREATAWQLARH